MGSGQPGPTETVIAPQSSARLVDSHLFDGSSTVVLWRKYGDRPLDQSVFRNRICTRCRPVDVIKIAVPSSVFASVNRRAPFNHPVAPAKLSSMLSEEKRTFRKSGCGKQRAFVNTISAAKQALSGVYPRTDSLVPPTSPSLSQTPTHVPVNKYSASCARTGDQLGAATVKKVTAKQPTPTFPSIVVPPSFANGLTRIRISRTRSHSREG